MPKADPEAARETAVKHLFRHLGDEQQLLRNPLVGPELLGGKLTAQELRARVANAAMIIRDEDVRLGRSDRGHRQWATLIRCDLGSQTVASLAGEFAISPRQLARERREAWLRTVQHILTKTAHITPASINDIVNNRALALFRLGRERDAAQIMREHIVRSGPETAFFCLSSLALMQYDFKRGHDARETYKELTSRFSPPESVHSQTRLSLTLCLLSVLLGQANPTRSWSARIQDLARRAALETPRALWVSRTILRVLFSLGQRFICAHDYANMLAIRYTIDEIAPSYEELDCHDALSLHGLKAISEWKRNGFNADMEANMLRALHLAVSNGWTAVVAEGASLLASVYYVRGKPGGAQDYRDMALIAASLTDEKGSIALTYCNLATAALDSGCVDAASRFSSLSASSIRDEPPLLEHVPLVGAEILVRQGHIKQGTAQARDVLRAAQRADNHRLVAIAGRVVALGLDAAGADREAIAVMKQSLDLSAAGCCSKYDMARMEESYREIARMEHHKTSQKLTYEHFWR